MKSFQGWRGTRSCSTSRAAPRRTTRRHWSGTKISTKKTTCSCGAPPQYNTTPPKNPTVRSFSWNRNQLLIFGATVLFARTTAALERGVLDDRGGSDDRDRRRRSEPRDRGGSDNNRSERRDRGGSDDNRSECRDRGGSDDSRFGHILGRLETSSIMFPHVPGCIGGNFCSSDASPPMHPGRCGNMMAMIF